ncbi:MAG: protein phosphatase 2C domain-containing protein [Pseudomonadota bacterium]
MNFDFFTHAIGLDDRAAVFQKNDLLIAIVADGAGGMSGASEAADYLVKYVQNKISKGVDSTLCCQMLAEIDNLLYKYPIAGETTGIIAVINTNNNCIVGASVGDSEAYIISNREGSHLTEYQYRKPLLGSGTAIPIPFAPMTLDGTLILGSDGLFKYARLSEISQIIKSYQPKESVLRLFELVRLPSGSFMDDVSVIVVKPK